MTALRRLIGYLRPYLGQMVLAVVLLTISGAMMSVVVATVKPLVNRVLTPPPAQQSALPEGDAGATAPPEDLLDRIASRLPGKGFEGWVGEHAFVQVPLLLVLIFLVRSPFQYFGQYLTIRAGASVIRDLRRDLYSAVAYQSLGFFQTHPTGLIVSRILNDVLRLQRLSTTVMANSIRVAAMMPALFVVALLHDWKMTLASLVVLPLLGYPMVRLGKRLRRASTASQEHMALVANRLTESVSGVKVVQGFGMESYEERRFGEALHRMLRADLKAGRAQSLGPTMMELLAAVAGGALFYVAGLLIARGRLDPGNFAVVLSSLGLLFMSIRRLNTFYAETQVAQATAVRIFDMIDSPREIRDAPGAVPLAPFERELRFEQLEFSYGDEIVLQRIDLTLAKGETVALVGPSGSGKSTLANLVPRFYDPTSGRILVDGTDLRSVTVQSLRGQIGLVTQETVLFDDTVRNNIAYGRADIPLERVIEVARSSQAHGFIEALPEGYDTMLGERGARLSMGQRQRITIARALIKDPPILILDEATSALDAESEVLVQEALEVLMRGRTSIVIAHRLATVRKADRILVMDGGRIVEQGSHGRLLALGGTYARLYELQFRESPP
jgi:subfamily B ATP-binding cassette protein MsbA